MLEATHALGVSSAANSTPSTSTPDAEKAYE
jgi:hypothetical protein